MNLKVADKLFMATFFKLTTFIVLIISASLRASTSFEQEWSLTSDTDKVKVWQYKTDSDVTGSWQERTPSKKFDWSKVGSESFFKELEADKIKMLSFLGIQEWNAEHYEWKKYPSGHELIIEGQYLDSQHKKIAFTEVYYFQELKTIQILQTRPLSTPKKLTDDFLSFIKDQLPK